MSPHRHLLGGLGFLLLTAIIIIIGGCGGSSGSGNPFEMPTGPGGSTGTITGNVTASNTINAAILPGNGPQAAVLVSGAEVWIEGAPEKKTTTDASGNFTLTGLTFGEHRVVAKITSGGSTFKVRSPALTVNSTTPARQTGALGLLAAGKVIRGILRDNDGNPIPNATLSLWGETFTTNSAGEFVSPPLPDDETRGLIKVVLAATFQTTSVEALLSSGKTVAFIELALARTGETNRAPLVFLSATKLEPSSGETVTLTASATDPDSADNSSLEAFWEKSDGTLVQAGTPFQMTWTAPSQVGVATISVRVVDSKGASGYGRIAFSIGGGTVPTNMPPSAVILGTTTAFVGNSVLFSVSASDSDGNLPLSFLWSGTGGTFSATTASQTLWTAPGTVGSYTIRCTVSDSKGALVVKFYTVQVVAITGNNRAPTGAIVSASQVQAGSALVVSATASDADNDVLSYQWSSSGGGTFSSTSAATTTWTAPLTAASVRLLCLVSDGRGGQFLASKTVQVASNSSNRIPTVSIVGTSTVAVGSSASFVANAADADGDVLSYAWAANGSGSFSTVTFASTTWTAPSATGTITMTCMVADGNGGKATATQIISVYIVGSSSGNVAPVVSIVGTSSVYTGDSSQFTASATDANGDVLAYSWTSTMGTLSHSNATATTWTAPSVTGTATLQCVVSDGKGGTTTTTKSVTVLQGNRTPTVSLSVVGSTSVPMASTAYLVATANDADGDTMSYLWTNASGGTLLSSGTTASTSWKAPTNATGTYYVTCRVSDSTGASVTSTLTLSVPDIAISSTGFSSGADLKDFPKYLKAAPSGENKSPPLTFTHVPANAVRLALICTDVTASFSHWLLYNIPSTTVSLAENLGKATPLADGSIQGENDFDDDTPGSEYDGTGYDGPDPGVADGFHYYHFTVYALDTDAITTAALASSTLVTAIQGHIISRATLIGKYQKP
jgi:Raf kinase inhibitor-like YbhB/YbcL family protein